jgi:hypothetical protein
MQSNAHFEWAVQASDLADLVAGPASEMRLCVLWSWHTRLTVHLEPRSRLLGEKLPITALCR